MFGGAFDNRVGSIVRWLERLAGSVMTDKHMGSSGEVIGDVRNPVGRTWWSLK